MLFFRSLIKPGNCETDLTHLKFCVQVSHCQLSHNFVAMSSHRMLAAGGGCCGLGAQSKREKPDKADGPEGTFVSEMLKEPHVDQSSESQNGSTQIPLGVREAPICWRILKGVRGSRAHVNLQ